MIGNSGHSDPQTLYPANFIRFNFNLAVFLCIGIFFAINPCQQAICRLKIHGTAYFKMNLIIYTSGLEDASERLMEMITTLAVEDTAEYFDSIDNLADRLNRPKSSHTVVIAHVATAKELTRLLLIYDFLQNIKLILILPDSKKSTVAKGHKLHPRFLSYADSDFSDICAVLNKMSGGQLHETTGKINY